MNTNSVPTMVLKFNTQHAAVRVKILNIVKEHIFAGKLIDVNYHYYDSILDEWYTLQRKDWDCTGEYGKGIQHSPSYFQYGRFDIIKNSALQSFDLEIWTTFAGI